MSSKVGNDNDYCDLHGIKKRRSSGEFWCGKCETSLELGRRRYQKLWKVLAMLLSVFIFITVFLAFFASPDNKKDNFGYWAPVVFSTSSISLLLTFNIVRKIIDSQFRAPDQRILPWYSEIPNKYISMALVSLSISIFYLLGKWIMTFLYDMILARILNPNKFNHAIVEWLVKGNHYALDYFIADDHGHHFDMIGVVTWLPSGLLLVIGANICLKILGRLNMIQLSAIFPDLGSERDDAPDFVYMGETKKAMLVKSSCWLYGFFLMVIFLIIQPIFNLLSSLFDKNIQLIKACGAIDAVLLLCIIAYYVRNKAMNINDANIVFNNVERGAAN